MAQRVYRRIDGITPSSRRPLCSQKSFSHDIDLRQQTESPRTSARSFLPVFLKSFLRSDLWISNFSNLSLRGGTPTRQSRYYAGNNGILHSASARHSIVSAALAPFKTTIQNKQKRQKLTASVLTFVMLFQIIAGVFAPVNIFNLKKNEAHAGWFDMGYGYKKEIKIDHTKVAGDLTNFPMLVSFTDPLFKTTGNGGRVTDANGYDIIFANAADTQKLDHEIEKYDATTGQVIMWVKISALSSSTDTSIYIYYGNSSITTSQENKTGVWDDGGANNFKGVYHLKETATGAAGAYKDSTVNVNHSTNTANQPTVTGAGAIGNAQGFNGSSNTIRIGNNIDLGNSGFTFDLWAKTSVSGAIQVPLHAPTTGVTNWAGEFRVPSSTRNSLLFVTGDIFRYYNPYDSSATTTDGKWHHFVGVCDRSQHVPPSVYLDGVLKNDTPGSYCDQLAGDLTFNGLYIGSKNTYYYFNGSIDEVRVSSTVRSAQWIATEYNNQSQPTEFASLGIEEVSSPTALSSFGYRKAITIDHTKVSGDLVNFPVLINLPTDASLAAHAQADGDDILFTSNSVAWNTGTVNDKLASEIETYTTATGALVAWVKTPNLSSTVDTVIYMYYGNDSATTQQNKTAVWDSNTKMVQHMNQAGTGVVGDYKDSTQYGNNSANTGNQPTLDTTGKIGNAESFDGVQKQINLNSSSSLNITNAITLSTWVKVNSFVDNSYEGLIWKLNSNDPGQATAYGLELYYPVDGTVGFMASTSGGYGDSVWANGDLSLNDWYYVTSTYDSSTNTSKIYLNGNLNKTDNINITGSILTYNSYTLIGKGAQTALNGSLDEVHISNTARSAQWISTEYNNQSKPTEFSSLGIEEISSPAVLSSFGYRKAITIDHTKIAGDLANFPVLINLPTDASLAAHAQADADDILFTANSIAWNTGTTNDRLAHEIETYTAATGSLQAWVKIPNLSSTVDTVIYMYYGNGSVTTQQNKTAVWDSNTKMVQHMEEMGTGAVGDYKDSTQHGNNSTNTGNQPTINPSGKIGNAESFDGVNDYMSCGNKDSLNLTNELTIGFWANIGTQTLAWPKIMQRGGYGAGGYYIDGASSVGNYTMAMFFGNLSGNSAAATSSLTYNINEWNHFTFSVNRTTNQGIAYKNGVAVGGIHTLPSYYDVVADFFPIATGSFNGSLDEVRISNTARSAAWISTEYNNQYKPTEFASLGIEEVSSPTALSSFGYRKAITIDHTKIAGDLANFPVLINLPTDTSLVTHAQADGDDILFTSNSVAWNNGTVNDKLASEIESFNSTTGSLQSWVRIPSLSSTVDTVIYLYYGNNSITSQQNKTVVWDGNTKMVQHMNQVGAGTVGDYKDSTQFQNNSSNTASQPTAATGQIDGAESFDGTSSLLNMGNGQSIDVVGNITLESWVKADTVTPTQSTIINKGSGIYSIALRGDKLGFLSNNDAWKTSTGSVSVNTWTHLVAVFDGVNDNFYINGVPSGISADNAPVSNISGNLQLGISGIQFFFDGFLDEIRISNTARSAQWVATEYNNQFNPTEFSSLGVEEVSAPAALSSFGYRKAITIDHTKVSGDLTNFPMLINLSSDVSLAAHAQADGDDILFASSSVAWNTGTVNDKLAHEIETYTTATGSLQAWVKIPNLSSTVDTVIYMYYGNGSVTSQQNKTAVWDGNTKMVQHMNQTGTGTMGDYRDSTQHGNNSTNTTGQPTAIVGQIDGAQNFDGIDDRVGFSGNKTTTVSIWVKPSTFGTDSYGNQIISQMDGCPGTNGGYEFAFRPGGNMVLVSAANGTNPGDWQMAYSAALDVWTNISFVWNPTSSSSSTQTFYINGQLSNQRSVAVGVPSLAVSPYLGRFSQCWPSRYFNGSIDEVRIANTARSAQWISTEYNNQSSPSTFSALGGEQIYRLEITGSATQTAGVSQPITLYAKDAAGDTMTGFNGDKSIILGGANAAPDGTNPTCRDKDGNDIAFGSPTTLTFTNGVAACDMKLVKAETASVTSSGTATITSDLSVTVSPNALDNFLVEVPASSNSGAAFATTITSRDAWNNTTLNVAGVTTLSSSAGTLNLTSLSVSRFTDDGVWSGNLILSDIIEQPSVVVTATNGAKTGTDSISILGIPQAPGSVSASRNSDTEFTVSWQDLSTVETNYDIERRTQTSGGWGNYVIIASVSANTTSFVDNATNDPANPPQADRAYQYRVRAQNSIGYSSYTEDSTIHYTTPNTPSGVFGTYLGDTSFRINYTDNAAVTDTHRIQRCSNGNCSSTFETDLGTFGASPQTDSTGIAANSRYRYQVRAEAPGSVNSNYAQSNFEYTTPSSPTIGTPTVISANQITVNWTDNSAYEDGFRIEVSTDGGAYTEVTPDTNTVGANISSYSFSSLGDRNYKFRVRAHIGATVNNGELFSPYSADSSTVYTPSAAPTLQAPIADSSTAITWNWLDNSAYEEAFRLHFITGSYADVDNLAANATSYQTTGLLPNTKYQTHMHSYRNDTGESIASSPSAQIYTLANVPDNLAATLSSQDHMTLNWQANSNPEGTEYLLENMNTGDMSDWITASSFTTGVLSCETEYSFRVKARNHDNAETAYSSTVTLMSSSCGAPLPQGAYNPPQAPAGDFKITINSNEPYTKDSTVKLTLSAGADTNRMAISNSNDFSQASSVPFQKEVLWNLGGLTSGIQEVGSRDGTYTIYAKFYTKYGIASKVVSDSIILDTTAPALNITNLKTKYLTTGSITLSGTTEANSKVIYNLDSVRVGVIDIPSDGKLTLSLGTLIAGTHSLKLIAQDRLGNSSDTMQLYLIVEKPVVIVPIIPNTPNLPTNPVSPKPNTPTDTNPITTPTPSTPSQPTTDVPDINTPDISDPVTNDPELGTDIVTSETPISMQGGWNLLTIRPFPKDISTQDIQMIIDKFPEFKETFQDLGLADFTNAEQLKNVSFNIPNLGEVMGLDPTDLTALNLPQPSTPIAQLSAQFKKEIPSDIVFVRTKENGIDINSALSFEEGNPNQKISLLSGQSFELVLRPDQDVNSIQGYITFKESKLSRSNNSTIVEKIAHLFNLNNSALAETDIEEKLVLSEFEYQDDDKDGIWTADIQTPQVSGEYELITVMDYKDVNLGDKTLRLITVVDPEGYVYRIEADGIEARIPQTTVSIYWFNDETKKYELWDADKYQQQNPQTTDERGTYSFLVPPGSYYLKAEAAGYVTYQSDPFDVAVGSGVHMNIELKRQADWKEQITWQNMLLVVFGAALFYNFYSDRKERRKLKAKEVV